VINRNYCSQFDRWRRLRVQNISVDFRLILNFDSDLADFASHPHLTDWEAKSVAGIVFSLQFAYGFGMIHGNLNSSHILFDESDRIQITDFALTELEMHRSESAAGLDVFGDEWTTRADIGGSKKYGPLRIPATS
jgi:hypothetical protein